MFAAIRYMSCLGKKLHPIWASENGPELPWLQRPNVLLDFCPIARNCSIIFVDFGGGWAGSRGHGMVGLCGASILPVGLVL